MTITISGTMELTGFIQKKTSYTYVYTDKGFVKVPTEYEVFIITDDEYNTFDFD